MRVPQDVVNFVLSWRSRRVSAFMHRRDAGRHGKFLIAIKVDVVDAHFAGLNSIHYLLKVLVFDLQSITD
jgi:hypothetical protein